MQEAYANGYWEELTQFIRSLFNSSFKTNPYMEQGLMVGITLVSKDSIFSMMSEDMVKDWFSRKISIRHYGFAFEGKKVLIG